MKTMARYIQVLTWTEENGDVHPIRFKINYEDGKNSVVSIVRVISVEKEKLAGNPMLIYKCQSLIKGEERVFEIKYELGTCRWFLFKI